MKQYKFMNPKTKLSIPEAEVYLKKKYGSDVISNFEDFDSEIPKYIQQFVGESGYKEKINLFALGINPIGNDNKTIWNKLAKDVCSIIADPMSYYDDILCAVYMGYIYGMEDNDLFKLQIDIPQKDNESKDDYRKRVNIEEQKLIDLKNKLQRAWKRKDIYVDKENVRRLYPVPVLQWCDTEEFKSGEPSIVDNEIKCEIQSIPGGCYDYHITMISQKHINIFDVESEIEDYTRYSFKNTYAICDSLKESYIENLLLMEYSLGIGYTNQMYSHIRDLNTINRVDGSLNVITAGALITPFVLRMKIMNLVFSSGIKLSTEKEVYNVETFVFAIRDVVSTVFERILELEWHKYRYFLSDDEKRLRYLYLQVKGIWERYFSDEDVYSDWINECGIKDWRNNKGVEDCFYDIMSDKEFQKMKKEPLQYIAPLEYSDKVIPIKIENVFGESIVICVGVPKNDVGDAIIKQVIEKMSETRFPETMTWMYKKYYKIRKNVYEEIKENEKEKFNKMEIKIRGREKNKTREQKLEKQHVYAMLSREVMKTLLCTK